jgi:uncharacterized protein YjbI with pentapeptide repeats
VAAIIIVLGYVLEWKWTGLVKDKDYTNRTLWDWMKLLIIPAVLAGGGIWFNRQQREHELRIDAQQRKREQDIAEQRAQDEALQAYLDQMSQLLTDKDRPLRQAKENDEVRTLARARTLTVLARLDGSRKWSVLMFLQEAGLISVEDGPVVSLQWANLQKADLGEVVLKGADLRETKLQGANLYAAKLQGARLVKANLSGADLTKADLSGADLSGTETNLNRANLRGAGLNRANLRQTKLSEADLSGANMIETDLRGADLSETNLSRVNLSTVNLKGANLKGANVTDEQLRRCDSLEGATMLNGQKYEDWLKSKGRREDKEKPGTS